MPQRVFEKKMTRMPHSKASELSRSFLSSASVIRALTVTLLEPFIVTISRSLACFPRWLVYMMGALVGGHASAKAGLEGRLLLFYFRLVVAYHSTFVAAYQSISFFYMVFCAIAYGSNTVVYFWSLCERALSCKANRTDTDCAPTHVVNGRSSTLAFQQEERREP